MISATYIIKQVCYLFKPVQNKFANFETMLKRFRVEESNDVVRVPVDVIRNATEATFRICGLTVHLI